MDGFISFGFIVLIMFIVVAIRGVVTVPQGYEYTLEFFRRYTRTLGPGLHLIVPFVENIGAKINMMEQVLDVPSQEAITKDNAMVRVDGVVFFQVMSAVKAAYQVSELNLSTLNLTMTNLRTVIGSMDLDELLSQREKINHQLLRVIWLIPWRAK